MKQHGVHNAHTHIYVAVVAFLLFSFILLLSSLSSLLPITVSVSASSVVVDLHYLLSSSAPPSFSTLPLITCPLNSFLFDFLSSPLSHHIYAPSISSSSAPLFLFSSPLPPITHALSSFPSPPPLHALLLFLPHPITPSTLSSFIPPHHPSLLHSLPLRLVLHSILPSLFLPSPSSPFLLPPQPLPLLFLYSLHLHVSPLCSLFPPYPIISHLSLSLSLFRHPCCPLLSSLRPPLRIL